MSEEIKLKIVVVGAGYGGLAVTNNLCKGLQANKNIHITLVSRQPFIFNNLASVRALVQADINPLIAGELTLNSKVFCKRPSSHCALVIGTIKEVLPGPNGSGGKIKVASTESESTIPYDYLVLATGSNYNAPFKVPEQFKTLEQWRNRLKELQGIVKDSKSVVVVGAGALGLEVSADIKTDFPDKTVNLVHSQPDPLPNAFPKTVAALKKKLALLEIKTIFSDRLVSMGPEKGSLPSEITRFDQEQSFFTASGQEIKADLFIPCSGTRPATEYVNPEWLEAETKRIKVNPFLQVEGNQNVFAIGDISNTKEGKTLMNCSVHADYVAEFLRSVAKAVKNQTALPQTPSKPHTLGKNIAFIALGRKKGVGQMSSSFIVGDIIVGNIKSKSMFVDKLKGYM